MHSKAQGVLRTLAVLALALASSSVAIGTAIDPAIHPVAQAKASGTPPKNIIKM